MSKRNLCLLGTLVLWYCNCFTQPTGVYYLRADMDEPWCCGWAPYPDSNPLTLDAVFGAGAWNLEYYEYTDPYAIFNDNTCFVFMEGGESHTDYMEDFFTINQTLIEQWVYDGGSLFINAAPNVGDGLSCGFGDVWLWYPYGWPGDVSNAPGALTHPIWNGPYIPLTSSMSGSSYAHAYITGSGLTPLIVDVYSPDQWVLAEKTWGSGHLFFGTMTTASWHWPNTEAVNIRQNMYSYMFLMCGLILNEGLLSFTAETAFETVKLNWQVTDPKPDYYFEIARSRNGTDWEIIGTMLTDNTADYGMIDDKPLSGKSYYRIAQLDENDHTLESKIASVNRTSNLEIYPIPATDFVVVEAEAAEDCNYSLFTINGNELPITLQKGIGEVLIKVDDLPSGLYILQIEIDNDFQCQRLVIE